MKSTMNQKILWASGLIAGLLVATSATLIAGEVIGLVTLTAATPGKFSVINNNFSAVETAVNDNHARVSALETHVTADGNIELDASTATTGNILKDGISFIHNFGISNTFMGERAGNFVMTGGSNTATGASALASNTDGHSNTAVGMHALLSNTTGLSNTAIGRQTLRNNTTGTGNAAIGASALNSNTTGSSNVAIGLAAGEGLQSGGNNIMIGVQAGQNFTGSENNNIAIGNLGDVGDSNAIRIGASQSRTFIAGIRGVTTGFADAVNVVVDSTGQLGTVNSSRRVKDDIVDMGETSAALMRLRPVTFYYKSDHNSAGRMRQFGLVAEEVANVAPELVAHSAKGEIETVYYQFLAPMLLNEYQKQQRVIEAQADELEEQNQRMAALESKIAQIAQVRQELERLAALIGRDDLAYVTREATH